MKLIGICVFMTAALTIPTLGQPSDLSFMNVASPANCGTADQVVVTTQQLFGAGTGFGCLKTLIFPQFVVGQGWTSQITALMPVQTSGAGLVTGTAPGFMAVLTPGAGAAAAPYYP